MKTFRFSLQSVRDLRQSQEDTAREVLSAALRARDQVTGRLRALDAELQEAWNEIRRNSARGSTSIDFQQGHAWCALLEARRTGIQTELADCHRKVHLRRQELQAATQRREMLDRLMKKQRSAHDQALLEEEQRVLDELAVRVSQRDSALTETL